VVLPQLSQLKMPFSGAGNPLAPKNRFLGTGHAMVRPYKFLSKKSKSSKKIENSKIKKKKIILANPPPPLAL
jgi:hypothetical protein